MRIREGFVPDSSLSFPVQFFLHFLPPQAVIAVVIVIPSSFFYHNMDQPDNPTPTPLEEFETFTFPHPHPTAVALLESGRGWFDWRKIPLLLFLLLLREQEGKAKGLSSFPHFIVHTMGEKDKILYCFQFLSNKTREGTPSPLPLRNQYNIRTPFY